MSYEHDRNGFGKLLILPFKKYIHCRDYFLPIFVKKAKRKISQTLKHLENGRTFETLKKMVLSFACFLKLISTSTLRNIMILCPLDSPEVRLPFKYLERHHIILGKFLEPLEVKKCAKNSWKHRNFESLNWLWKTRFYLLGIFWGLASLLRFVMSLFDVR